MFKRRLIRKPSEEELEEFMDNQQATVSNNDIQVPMIGSF